MNGLVRFVKSPFGWRVGYVFQTSFPVPVSVRTRGNSISVQGEFHVRPEVGDCCLKPHRLMRRFK